MPIGTVRFFNDLKGRGFVRPDGVRQAQVGPTTDQPAT